LNLAFYFILLFYFILGGSLTDPILLNKIEWNFGSFSHSIGNGGAEGWIIIFF
jgi:hypothetical protein